LPVFLPPPKPKDATLWAILSWGSALLHGMSRLLHPGPLGRGYLSWGLMPLRRFGSRESTPRSVSLAGSPVPRDSPTGPTPPTTVPFAGFLSLSTAFFLSLPSCHFQAGGAHGVSSFRGSFLPHSLVDSSPTTCPLDVLPADCAAPVLGGGVRGLAGRYLGCLDRASLIVFRALSRWEIGLRR